MHQNHCRGIVLQSGLHDLPWVDTGTIQRAAKQFLECDHPVPAVEHEQGEHLMLVLRQQRL
ncbi:hypothetical protein D3C85_1870810 [compost metagenome]